MTCTETRICWFRVFVDLKMKQWSPQRIEKELDIARSTMLGWRAGASPKHEDGELLIALWQEVTGKTRESLPTEKRYPNAYRRR